MSPIVQVCIVVVTVAIVALAFMATRMIIRFDAMARSLDEGLLQLQQILEEGRVTSQRVHELIDVADDTVLSVRRCLVRIERVVGQATSVGSAVLDEFERPIKRATALWKGLEAGASLLRERWANGTSSDSVVRKGERDV